MTVEEFNANAPQRHANNPAHYTAAFRRYVVLNTRGMTAAEASALAGVSLRAINDWRRIGEDTQWRDKAAAEIVHAAWAATRSAESAERAAADASHALAVVKGQLSMEQSRRRAAEAMVADLVARMDAMERQLRMLTHQRRGAA